MQLVGLICFPAEHPVLRESNPEQNDCPQSHPSIKVTTESLNEQQELLMENIEDGGSAEGCIGDTTAIQSDGEGRQFHRDTTGGGDGSGGHCDAIVLTVLPSCPNRFYR